MARDVASALTGEQFSSRPWGFASNATWITSAAGHLLAEMPPEHYDERLKVWRYDDLPVLPERFFYTARDKRAGERLRQIRDLLHDDHVTSVVLATDAGREGELIGRLILQAARLDGSKPVERAWFSSMTADAISQAFDTLRPGRDLEPLEAAARCRAEADWLVGMNATRAATTTLGGGRTLIALGRVQTPTLAMIVRRDLSIEEFTAEPFATLHVTFTADSGSYVGEWRSSPDSDATTRFDSREAAAARAAIIAASNTGTVIGFDTTDETAKPPALFDLTGLQREANTRHGYTAAKTLELAQTLYERHKVLSYPRTDSKAITSDMQPQIPTVIAALGAADPTFRPAAQAHHDAGVDGSALVNDAGVSDHHGLLPVLTNGNINLTGLSPEERHIFDLVAFRFLAALGEPHRLQRTVVLTEVSGPDGADVFRTAGKTIVDNGWKEWWPAAADDDTTVVPPLTAGQQVERGDIDIRESSTKPPKRFTEASLLAAMETAGKDLDDDALMEALAESGLGTPATRAATIEKLLSSGYAERNKKALQATSKGRGVILALGDHPLTSPALTGEWEQRLKELEQASPDDAQNLRLSFMADARTFTTDIVTGMKDADPEALRAGRKQLAECPRPDCTGHIVEGAKGWGCDSYRSAEQPGCGIIIWKKPRTGRAITEAAMLKRVAAMAAGTEPLPSPVEPAVTIADCPSDGCDGQIVKRAKSFGCTSWKGPKTPGCGFVIWRNVGQSNEVDDEQARQMIAAGQTNHGTVDAFADCPSDGCDGQIVKRAKSFGCTSWKGPKTPGCGFVIWRNVGQSNEVDDEQARQMITAGKSDAPETIGPCPKARCKGRLTVFEKVISCSTNRRDGSGCGTKAFRFNRDGTPRSDEEVNADLQPKPKK